MEQSPEKDGEALEGAPASLLFTHLAPTPAPPVSQEALGCGLSGANSVIWRLLLGATLTSQLPRLLWAAIPGEDRGHQGRERGCRGSCWLWARGQALEN